MALNIEISNHFKDEIFSSYSNFKLMWQLYRIQDINQITHNDH